MQSIPLFLFVFFLALEHTEAVTGGVLWKKGVLSEAYLGPFEASVM